jgi:iron complex outermembrane receptor protein
MNNMFWRAFIGFLGFLCTRTNLNGQSTVPDSTDYKTLDPVSVYAFKTGAAKSGVRLSNADWIQHDAGQVLMQINGISAIRKGGNYGFDPVFRGFRLDQLNIINNGAMTAHAACPNRMDPPVSQVMISQVEQIEVWKGPHNFRYGPSTGAVINFKTAAPQFSPRKMTFGRVSLGGESNGGIFRTEGVAGYRDPNWQVSVSGSFSKGWDYRAGNDSIMPARFSRGALSLNVDRRIADGQVLTVSITRNQARNTSFPTLMMDLLSDDTWMIQGKYGITGAGKWQRDWQTQVFTSMVDHQMGNRLRPTSSNMLTHVFADTRTSGGRSELHLRRKGTNIWMGADVRYEFADGTRSRKMITGPMAGKIFYDTLWQQGSIMRSGVFTHAQINRGAWLYSVSGRLDAVSGRPHISAAKYTQANPDLTRTDLNPNLSAGITRRLGSNFSAGAWLGQGRRSAGVMERFINFLPVGMDAYEVMGNPQLKPETNTQFDLLLQYRTEQTDFSFNFFGSRMKDMISSVIDPMLKPMIASAPGVRRMINIDEAKRWGFEGRWQQHIGEILNNEISVSYTNGQDVTLGMPLPEIAPMDLRESISVKLWKEKLSANATLRHVMSQDRISTAFGEKSTEAFTTVDLGVAARPVSGIQVSLGVQNLFDVAYREHLNRFIREGVPLLSTGRNFVLMAAYQF